MAPVRATRRLGMENDENSAAATTRMTRAKAASLGGDDGAVVKAVASKKTALGAANARKRAALGDVSNVAKVDEKRVGKAGLGKTTAGVAKPRASGRTALAAKETRKVSEPKRAGSGSGSLGKRKSDAVAKDSGMGPLRKKVMRDDRLLAAATVPEHLKATINELEKDDFEDPLMVAEYANEIFAYLQELEIKTLPNANYMDHQDDIEWKTRGILVDWLIEVHTRFHLLPETLFLAINLIDRFLSEKVVNLDRLQLVGIAAMFTASKYEEVLSPHVGSFRHVTDDGFTEAEILSAERVMLGVLNYDLSYPNPMNFLRRISKADNYDIKSRTVGKYLMEISIVDHRFMQYKPSHVAAASMYLSRMILRRGEWTDTLHYYSGYTEDEIEPVAHLMVDYLVGPIAHEAFFKKYASTKFGKASIIARQWAKAHHRAGSGASS